MSSTQKIELRRQLREQRRAVEPAARRAAGERLAAQLTATRVFRVSRRIACYVPADGEIDTAAIMLASARRRKTCYLPVLSRIGHDRLWFVPFGANTAMAPNRYGIPEPRVPARRRVRAGALDLILLPLVGFDAKGQRLGMGLGFYDRSLEYLIRRTRWHRPRLVGLAYDFQKLAALPGDAWDVPLDAIVTDQTVYAIPQQE